MRFGQSIEYSKKKVFFIKSHAEIEAGRIVASPFFKKKNSALYEVKASGL